MTWTTPEQLREELERRWQRGDFLRAYVQGESLFPLEVPLKRPGPRDVADRFGEVMDWVHHLRKGSVEGRGYGYQLRWEGVRNRVQGRNELPVAAVFPSEQDALRLIRRQAEAERSRELVDTLVE